MSITVANSKIDVENKMAFFNGAWVKYAVLMNHKRRGRIFNFSRYLILEVGEVLYADTLKRVWQDEDRDTNYLYTKLYPDEPLYDEKGNKLRIRFWIARLVYEAFFGEIGIDPTTGRLMEIDHQDHNPLNNTLTNLIRVTHKQNKRQEKPEKQLYSGKHYKNTKARKTADELNFGGYTNENP